MSETPAAKQTRRPPAGLTSICSLFWCFPCLRKHPTIGTLLLIVVGGRPPQHRLAVFALEQAVVKDGLLLTISEVSASSDPPRQGPCMLA